MSYRKTESLVGIAEPTNSSQQTETENTPGEAAPNPPSSIDRLKSALLAIWRWMWRSRSFVISLAIHSLLILILMIYTLAKPPRKPALALINVDTTLDVPIDTFDSIAPFDDPEKVTLRPPGGGPMRDPTEAIEGDPSEKASTKAASNVLADLVSKNQAGDGAGSGLGLTDGLGGGGGEGVGSAEFFGVRAKGRKFVFVVDRSGSMADHEAMEKAKRELQERVSSLDPNMQFQVLFYNTDVEKLTTQEQGLITVSRRAIREAVKEIDMISPMGGTSHVKAIRAGLNLKPDAVFVLTDAKIDQEEDLTDAQINELTNLNRQQASARGGPGRKTTIHVIHFRHVSMLDRPPPDDAAGPGRRRKRTPQNQGGPMERPIVLKRLAEENNGTYTVIPLK